MCTSHRFVAHDKGDRPPSLKGRRPVITSLEMFLWRNYLIFTSCTAPPSSVTSDSSALDSSVRSQPQLSARDLFHKVSQFMLRAAPMGQTDRLQLMRIVPFSHGSDRQAVPHEDCSLLPYTMSIVSPMSPTHVLPVQEKAWEQDCTVKRSSSSVQVVPQLRTDGEIREVAITALGLVNPNAFGYATAVSILAFL